MQPLSRLDHSRRSKAAPLLLTLTCPRRLAKSDDINAIDIANCLGH